MAESAKSAVSSQASKVALGVESLIERLRNEGVANGRAEAERIIQEAKDDAAAIRSKAQEEADRIVTQARNEASNLEQAGHQALQVAARDTALDLRNRLEQRFAGEVRHLVREETEREEFLEKLILEVAGRTREEAATSEKAEVLLPEKAAGLDDLTKDPNKMRDTPLGHFATLVTRSLLRQGVTLATSRDLKSGIKVRLIDKGIDLDLSDKAIGDLLLQHLQPRFRALLEGIL
jgi:V/A-type H+-transporting ATPase subunit E